MPALNADLLGVFARCVTIVDVSERDELREENAILRRRVAALEQAAGDAGDGLDLQHIFEPFFTTKSSGTGLGLSVTYGILNDHNATVFVDSTPGEGTRFVVTFPIAEPHR